MSRVKTGNENRSESGSQDQGRLLQKCSITSSFRLGTGRFSKKVLTAAAQGTAAPARVSHLFMNTAASAPWTHAHVHTRTHTTYCQVMGMVVLNCYIRKKKRKKGETRRPQGGFWVSTLCQLMLGKRETTEIVGWVGSEVKSQWAVIKQQESLKESSDSEGERDTQGVLLVCGDVQSWPKSNIDDVNQQGFTAKPLSGNRCRYRKYARVKRPAI